MPEQYRTQSLTCASCGAPLTPKAGGLVCSHCGSFQILYEEVSPPPSSTDQSGDSFAYRGIQAYQQREYVVAVRELEQALTLQVNRYSEVEILTVLGNAYDELNNYSKAIACYQRALEKDPRFFQAWVGLGIAQRHKGNVQEAERCYQEALSIEPEYAELHASLGALYIHKGEVESAIRSLEQAIRLNPAVAVAHGNIALAYAMARRFADAEFSLRQAVALGYTSFKTVQERITALKALG